MSHQNEQAPLYPERQKITVNHRYLPVNELTIHVAEEGNPQAPLILFIHGFPEYWYSWRRQMKAVADAGYYAVAVDMPGYGESSAPADPTRYNQVALSDDIGAVASALGHDSFVPVGHDYGAPTAWHCALRFPQRVPLIVGMSIPYGGRPPKSPSAGFNQLFSNQFFYINYFQRVGVAEEELQSNLSEFLRSFFYYSSGDTGVSFDTSDVPASANYLTALPDPGQLPGWLDLEHFQRYVDNFRSSGLNGPLSYYRNFDLTWRLTADLAEKTIEQPALFISGEFDPVTKFGAEYERMDRWVPQVEKVVIPKAGHWVQQEAPDEVNGLLLEFLRENQAMLEDHSGRDVQKAAQQGVVSP